MKEELQAKQGLSRARVRDCLPEISRLLFVLVAFSRRLIFSVRLCVLGLPLLGERSGLFCLPLIPLGGRPGSCLPWSPASGSFFGASGLVKGLCRLSRFLESQSTNGDGLSQCGLHVLIVQNVPVLITQDDCRDHSFAQGCLNP